jgi:allophanate hydrolase subunit 2
MERSLVVVKPGPLSTVQDLGRVGVQHLGFSPSGAADATAVEIGNRLLCNEPGAAAIEVTLGGAAFRFESSVAVAVTGAAARPSSLRATASRRAPTALDSSWKGRASFTQRARISSPKG